MSPPTFKPISVTAFCSLSCCQRHLRAGQGLTCPKVGRAQSDLGFWLNTVVPAVQKSTAGWWRHWKLKSGNLGDLLSNVAVSIISLLFYSGGFIIINVVVFLSMLFYMSCVHLFSLYVGGGQRLLYLWLSWSKDRSCSNVFVKMIPGYPPWCFSVNICSVWSSKLGWGGRGERPAIEVSGSQREGPSTTSLASLRNALEMSALLALLSETLEVRSSNWCLPKPSSTFWHVLMFEKECSNKSLLALWHLHRPCSLKRRPLPLIRWG